MRIKTFLRHKSYGEIKAQCAALHLLFVDAAYKAGSDSITVRGGGGYVVYNTASGRFCGRTDLGVTFSSDSNRFEKEQWFKTLLDFFYTDTPD